MRPREWESEGDTPAPADAAPRPFGESFGLLGACPLSGVEEPALFGESSLSPSACHGIEGRPPRQAEGRDLSHRSSPESPGAGINGQDQNTDGGADPRRR